MKQLINHSDLKFDVLDDNREKGGQYVPSMNHAVRITHMPTGLMVTCKTERSQHRNVAVCIAMIEAGLAKIGEANGK